MLCWYLKNSHLTNKPETNNALILPWLLSPPFISALFIWYLKLFKATLY